MLLLNEENSSFKEEVWNEELTLLGTLLNLLGDKNIFGEEDASLMKLTNLLVKIEVDNEEVMLILLMYNLLNNVFM